MISTKLTDPDDRVRAAACAAFESLNYEAATHAFDANLLRALADRIIDKKVVEGNVQPRINALTLRPGLSTARSAEEPSSTV